MQVISSCLDICAPRRHLQLLRPPFVRQHQVRAKVLCQQLCQSPLQESEQIGTSTDMSTTKSIRSERGSRKEARVRDALKRSGSDSRHCITDDSGQTVNTSKWVAASEPTFRRHGHRGPWAGELSGQFTHCRCNLSIAVRLATHD